MEGNRFEDIFRRLIFIQLFLTSVCVGALPCMPESDRFGQYKIRGGGGNILSVGIPSGSRVKVSIRCDMGATAQQSVTSQCSNGTWIPPWPRCEKPCSVPRNRGPVRQFVNGDAMRPISSYYTPSTLPAGTQLVARCRDPGKYRLIGDQRRTCEGGRWTGEEPECQPVETQFLFYGALREVASNGTIVVYVHRGHPMRLDVVCYITSVWLRPPRLTTPLVNDEDLQHWNWPKSHGKRLDPISTDFSGIYTCSGSSSFHSVHVLFKESTEPPQNHGSCSNSCCVSPEYSCNPEGCYCDSWCESNDNCCDDYEDVCPGLDILTNVFISNTTYNMRGGDYLLVYSPKYSKIYNNFDKIIWHVRNVHGRQFRMTFWHVRHHSNRDYIRIYTGISDVFEESTQIFHLTYNLPGDLPHQYWSVHPNMWLQFSTETFGIDEGFYISILSSSLGVSDCDGSLFQCTNGQCIYSSAVCDGFSDCVDSSDEYCTPKNGSCSDSCCVNSEYSCNPDGCYCDSMCVDNGNCCDDYSDVCPTPGNGTAQHSTQFTTPSLILNSGSECRWNLCLNQGVCWNRRTTGSRFCRCLPGTSGDQCEKTAECWAPAAPVHGRILDGSRQQARDIFPSGTSVSFECEDDYRLVGYWNITCEKGQWSDGPPVCTVSRCPVLNIPDHVVIEGVHFSDGRNIGDERIFNCVEGYVLQGDTNNLRCLESGVWSDPLPTCEESTEPPKNNGSCSNSCCTSSEYPCFIEDCYCDFECVSLYDCCDDYEDVCPTLERSIG